MVKTNATWHEFEVKLKEISASYIPPTPHPPFFFSLSDTQNIEECNNLLCWQYSISRLCNINLSIKIETY